MLSLRQSEIGSPESTFLPDFAFRGGTDPFFTRDCRLWQMWTLRIEVDQLFAQLTYKKMLILVQGPRNGRTFYIVQIGFCGHSRYFTYKWISFPVEGVYYMSSCQPNIFMGVQMVTYPPYILKCSKVSAFRPPPYSKKYLQLHSRQNKM